jgi:hypothetical protein
MCAAARCPPGSLLERTDEARPPSHTDPATLAPKLAPTLAGRRPLGHTGGMLHIAKLAVGIRDVAHIRAVQAERMRTDPPLRHLTRNHPRRAAEVLDGGSLYWVIGGSMLVRQRLLDIRDEETADGGTLAALVLDPALVLLTGKPTRPFQGWRYLDPAAAPPDLSTAAAGGVEALPEAMRRDLRELGLL